MAKPSAPKVGQLPDGRWVRLCSDKDCRRPRSEELGSSRCDYCIALDYVSKHKGGKGADPVRYQQALATLQTQAPPKSKHRKMRPEQEQYIVASFGARDPSKPLPPRPQLPWETYDDWQEALRQEAYRAANPPSEEEMEKKAKEDCEKSFQAQKEQEKMPEELARMHKKTAEDKEAGRAYIEDRLRIPEIRAGIPESLMLFLEAYYHERPLMK